MIVVKYRDDRFRTGSAADEIFQNTHGIAFVFVVVLAEFIDKDPHRTMDIIVQFKDFFRCIFCTSRANIK